MPTSRTLKLPTSYHIATSASERLVAAVGRKVVLADLQQRKRLWSTHALSHPSSADFSGDESMLAVKSTWGEIALLDTVSGDTLVSTRPKAQDEGADIRFAGADHLIDCSRSGDIRVRQVSDLAVIETFHFENQLIPTVSFNAERQVWLFFHIPKWLNNTRRNDYITIWDWPLKQPKAELDTGLSGITAELSPSGEQIALSGLDASSRTNELRVLTLDGSLIAKVQTKSLATVVRWSRDSKSIATCEMQGGFHVFDAQTLALRAQFQEMYPSDIAFIENDSRLILGSCTAGCIVDLTEALFSYS
jgi:hypothetical protein